MRALGLPNTKHFHEITKIEDAMTCKYSTAFVLLRIVRLMRALQWRSD